MEGLGGYTLSFYLTPMHWDSGSNIFLTVMLNDEQSIPSGLSNILMLGYKLILTEALTELKLEVVHHSS